MASGGHLLIQQKHTVEARIKTLINSDLKAICRIYDQPVSGTKLLLQDRCIRLLEAFISKGDELGFNEFKTRVANHGSLPAGRAPQPSYGHSAISVPQPGMRPPQNHTGSHLSFKSSPFYERVEVVLAPHDLPEMPQNRHTVRVNVRLSENQARLLSRDANIYRLLLYCGQTGMSNYVSLDVSFPNQIEVKVNDDDVKSNFKGLKNKPGSTKPADITKMIRARAGYDNKLSVCYALTTRRYAFTVLLVRQIPTDALVAKIRSARVIPKHKVLEEMNRINSDPDVAATSSKMSLKDPISTARIQVPVRSTVCQHNQCFDASNFMQLQEQAPTWNCPICAKTLSFESLCVDKYFEDILSSTTRSIEQVTVEPNGVWRVVKEDEEKSLSNFAKGGPRASYDDDYDDDIVELDEDSANTALNGLKREFSVSALNAFNTPPLSSREPSVAQSASAGGGHTNGTKRRSNVIDLTLSDDEDEPPRPAKRVATDAAASRSTQPYRNTGFVPADSMNGSRNPPSRPFISHQKPSSASLTSQIDQRSLQSPINISPFGPNSAPAAAAATLGRPSGQSAGPQYGASHGIAPSTWGMRSPSVAQTVQSTSSRPPSTSQSPPRWNALSPPTAPADSRSWQHSGTAGGVMLPTIQHQHLPPTFPTTRNRTQGQNYSSDGTFGGSGDNEGGWRPPNRYTGDSQSPG